MIPAPKSSGKGEGNSVVLEESVPIIRKILVETLNFGKALELPLMLPEIYQSLGFFEGMSGW